MRKFATGLLIAASALALAGCEKKAESTVDAMADTTEAATTAATEGTDADAAATGEGDPNGNPVKP
jgi:PBP1b-binding outer membrane lipoprotein LpoB